MFEAVHFDVTSFNQLTLHRVTGRASDHMRAQSGKRVQRFSIPRSSSIGQALAEEFLHESIGGPLPISQSS